MKTKLILFYALIWIAIVSVTTWASFAGGNVLDATVQLWNMPWGRATFFDTYFAFTTIWLWMAYREKTWVSRIAWFFLVMTLGNIAVSAYMLWNLLKLKPNATVQDFLIGKKG
jgi:hypothetical protein